MFPPILPRPTKPICIATTYLLVLCLAGCAAPADPPEDEGRSVVARLCRELPVRLGRVTPPRDYADLPRIGRDAAPIVIDALAELKAIRTRGVRTFVDELEDALGDAISDLDSLAAGEEPGTVTDSLGLQLVRAQSVTRAMKFRDCGGPQDTRGLDPLREPVYERELPLADTPTEVQELREPLHAVAQHERVVRALREGDRVAERRARRAVLAKISAARAARGL
jgi:hypothetical protein